jgi:hypothetical protein
VGALLAGAGLLALRAPLQGVVTRVTTTPGESREPSSGPLLSIAGTGPVRVEARFPRPVLDGQWAFVGGTGTRSALLLKSRAPTADPHDGTYVAWFEPSSPLVAGALGRAVLTPAEAPSTFLVPAAAIRRQDGAAFVDTRRGQVQVSVLRCEGERCTATGALSPEDEVRVGAP